MGAKDVNQLRSEILDQRAASLNRWLAVMSLILTVLAILVTVGGVFGVDRVNQGIRQVQEDAGQIRDLRSHAESIVAELEHDYRRLIKTQVEAAIASVLVPERSSDAPSAVSAGMPDPADTGSMKEDPGTDELEMLLLSSQGYGPLRTWSGSLVGGQSKTLDLNLSAEQSYWVVAECGGGDCDLDLTMKSESGQILDQDDLPDDTPIVRYDATQASVATLEVAMYSCELDCTWELRAYVRQTAPGP